jgi:hypothetical protein
MCESLSSARKRPLQWRGEGAPWGTEERKAGAGNSSLKRICFSARCKVSQWRIPHREVPTETHSQVSSAHLSVVSDESINGHHHHVRSLTKSLLLEELGMHAAKLLRSCASTSLSGVVSLQLPRLLSNGGPRGLAYPFGPLSPPTNKSRFLRSSR